MAETVQESSSAQHYHDLKQAIEALPPADGSKALLELSPTERAVVFRLLSKDYAIELFEALETDEQQSLLDHLHDNEVLNLLEDMSHDDRARLLDEMPAKVARKLIERLTPERREATALLLGYAPYTAGRIMSPAFVSLKASFTVAEALEYIRRRGLDRETIYYLYITDNSRRLQGVLSLRQLVLADPDQPIADLYEQNVISVRTDTDQETVARVIETHDLLAVPVVDSENRLVGIVTVDDALDVLDEEATKDFHLLGAVSASDGRARYFQLPLWRRMAWRLPWLVVLLFAGIISGNLISLYEESLSAVIALAFFIPMMMGTAGNTGSQAVTLVVRAIATGEVASRHFWRAALIEIGTGIALGIALGSLAGAIATLMTGELLLGVTIAVSLCATVVVAGLIGTALPFLLHRWGFDPAVASTPLVTTIGDAIGILIYFSVATMLFDL